MLAGHIHAPGKIKLVNVLEPRLEPRPPGETGPGEIIFQVELACLCGSDLLFFEGHVGMYLGSGEMIHSSRTQNGVGITDLKYETDYSKELRDKYRCARRLEGSSGNSLEGGN